MNTRVKRLVLPIGGAIAATSMIGATLVATADASTAPTKKVVTLASSSNAQKITDFWTEKGSANLKAAAQFQGDQANSSKIKLGGGDAAPDGKAGTVAPIGSEKKSTAKVKNINLPKTIGKVFFTVGDKEYWCSASSVQSKYHNLVATAGHCVFDEGVQNGALDNWVFIPGYYQGKTPWGIYVGKAAYTHYDFAVYEDYDSDYAFVTVYNGINYAGEKEVTKSTYDQWQGQKYAKDEKITKDAFDKGYEKYGEAGPYWKKTSDATVESVAMPSDAAAHLKEYTSAEGYNGVKLTGVEVTKSVYTAAKKGLDNGNQYEGLSNRVAISQEEYKALVAKKGDGGFLGELTATKDSAGAETAWFKQQFFVKKWVKSTTVEEYYLTHFYIEYFKDAGRLGDNVGGQGFAWNVKVGHPVFVFGYPAGAHPDGDKPFTGVTPKWCYGKTFAAAAAAKFKAEAQIGLKCSMTAGSSGAPWILKYNNSKRVGYINGVTSLIGDADANGRIDFSTSPYFDGETYSVYKSAASLWSGKIVTKDGALVSKA